LPANGLTIRGLFPPAVLRGACKTRECECGPLSASGHLECRLLRRRKAHGRRPSPPRAPTPRTPPGAPPPQTPLPHTPGPGRRAVVTGKKGLDAFPGTDLEALLLEHGIRTVALAGFLTNCCVEAGASLPNQSINHPTTCCLAPPLEHNIWALEQPQCVFKGYLLFLPRQLSTMIWQSSIDHNMPPIPPLPRTAFPPCFLNVRLVVGHWNPGRGPGSSTMRTAYEKGFLRHPSVTPVHTLGIQP